jgi:Rod binding domain-containing protein
MLLTLAPLPPRGGEVQNLGSYGEGHMKVVSTDGPSSVSNKEVHQQKLKKACEDFEAIMVTYLFKSMRQTSLKSETEEFGSTKDLFEGMLDETLATQLSHQQGLGLARLLYEQLAPVMESKEASLRLNGSKDSSSGTLEPTSQ